MTRTLVHSYALRDARTADVKAMAAIEVEAFSDPWSASAFTDVLRMAESVGETGFVYGIDVSDGMLKKARQNAEKLKVNGVFLAG